MIRDEYYIISMKISGGREGQYIYFFRNRKSFLLQLLREMVGVADGLFSKVPKFVD